MTGAYLRQIRLRMNLTWHDIARRCGVSWRTVARWEASGKLSRTQLAKMQRLLWELARTPLAQGREVCPVCCGQGTMPRGTYEQFKAQHPTLDA